MTTEYTKLNARHKDATEYARELERLLDEHAKRERLTRFRAMAVYAAMIIVELAVLAVIFHELYCIII